MKYELNNGGKRITRICILGSKKDFGIPFTSRRTGTDSIKAVAVPRDHKTVAAEASVKMEEK